MDNFLYEEKKVLTIVLFPIFLFSVFFSVYSIKYSINIDFNYALIIFWISILLAYLFTSVNNTKVILIGYPLFIISQVYHFLNENPLQFNDSINYYSYLMQFQSYTDYYTTIGNDIFSNFIFMSIWNAFVFFVFPFYELFGTNDPKLFIIFNSILLLGIFLIFSRLLNKHLEINISYKKSMIALALFFLISSGSFSYWSSMFLKDILALLIILIGTLFLIEKKYVFFSIVTLISYTIRPYSVLIMICYFVFFKFKKRMVGLGMLFSSLVVIGMSGLNGLLNIPNSIVTMFLAPNPFWLKNWQDFPFRSIDSLIMAFTLSLVVITYLFRKDTREFYNLSFGVLFIYACILTLISFEHASYLGLDYQVGVAVDDLSRKKLMVMPIMYIISSYTFLIYIKKYVVK